MKYEMIIYGRTFLWGSSPILDCKAWKGVRLCGKSNVFRRALCLSKAESRALLQSDVHSLMLFTNASFSKVSIVVASDLAPEPTLCTVRFLSKYRDDRFKLDSYLRSLARLLITFEKNTGKFLQTIPGQLWKQAIHLYFTRIINCPHSILGRSHPYSSTVLEMGL